MIFAVGIIMLRINRENISRILIYISVALRVDFPDSSRLSIHHQSKTYENGFHWAFT